MHLTIVGTGYVGLVTGTCLAEMGNDVVCVDIDEAKIARLSKGEIPIYEPGLEELVEANRAEGRLNFSSDLSGALRDSQIVMIAVGTPAQADGSADLSAVFEVARQTALHAPRSAVIVTKSTVPVGTAARIRERLTAWDRSDIDVVSNPEFLKQGDAVNDFLRPDRVVIGADSHAAELLMRELYAPFLRTGNRVVVMDVASAEMTKYVANAFLATKISFINEVSRLCEVVGADIESVRAGICSDIRIGDKFLFPGLGYGGSCFPKDIKALIQTGSESGVPMTILHAVDEVNQSQRHEFIRRVGERLPNLKGMKLALWGLAFKPRTDDIREAPALTVIDWLLEQGATVHAFDPKARARVEQIYGDRIRYGDNAYEVVEGADALLIVTEWNEFRRPDLERVRAALKQPIVFDGRNLYEPERMRARGFEYYCIGRPNPTKG